MSALATGRAVNFLNAEYGGGATPTAFVARTGHTQLILTTAVGSQSARGTGLAAGGGYSAAGHDILWNAAAAVAAPGTYSGKIGNQALSITNMPASTNLNGIEIEDAAATPVYMAYGALTGAPKTTNAGDTLSFPADSITVEI